MTLLEQGVADTVIRLPMALRLEEDVSLHELLVGSGYVEHHEQIAEEVIRERFALAPQCADDWIGYSEDKRTETGWYLRVLGKGKFEVGYIGGADDEGSMTTYSDKLDACAKFVKMEVESLRIGG
jgi:hypothetical protein